MFNPVAGYKISTYEELVIFEETESGEEVALSVEQALAISYRLLAAANKAANWEGVDNVQHVL